MKTAKTPHLDEAALLRHAAADESRTGAAATRKHLAACAACRKQFEASRRIHVGLTAIGAAEKRRAKGAASAVRISAYRETVGQAFAESRQAERAADKILKAARLGSEELAATLESVSGEAYHDFALLLAVRNGTPLVGFDPRKAWALAEAVRGAVPLRNARGTLPVVPIEPRAVHADALLLAGRALIQEYRADEARRMAIRARSLLEHLRGYRREAGVCDFQEAEAALYCRDYCGAEGLIRRAVKTFELSGSFDMVAKSWAVMGTIRSNTGRYGAALPYFKRAINALDPDADAFALSATLNNRASALAQLGRFAEAEAEYAKALKQALRHGFHSIVRVLRTGLAEVEFLRGRYTSAVRLFRRIAADYATIGSAVDVLFVRLFIAESLGRLGDFASMAEEVEAIRISRRASRFHRSPALEELFFCLEEGMLDADLVCHVRQYLQDAQRGVQRSYRTLRRA